ncbi:MAG: NusG domain II-containing protein [Candidatus Cloacimonetes bacterium]|nr:NusG domain II-containing protein [Candidatus Cloacimonadota bacterium]
MSFKKALKEISIADMLLLILILFSIFMSAKYFSKADNAQSVYIYKDNSLIEVYPLEKDASIIIDTHNRVQIKGGKVRMSYSDCHDKRCVKQGYSDSMPIICLPNKVIIEVKANPKDKRFILQ